MFSCVSLSLPPYVNDLVHTVQGKGLSPEWVFMCRFKCAPCVKVLVQTVLSKRFSPECALMCRFKLEI